MSPVTQTEDVDVKSASVKEIPLVVDIGSISRTVPAAMSRRKPVRSILWGDAFVLKYEVLISDYYTSGVFNKEEQNRTENRRRLTDKRRMVRRPRCSALIL